MGDNGRYICAVCCLEFSKCQALSETKYRYNLKKLNVAVVNGNSSQPIESCARASSGIKKALNSLQVPPICPNCISIAVTALDRKRKVVSLESEVRKLQLQILKILRNLQGEISGFQDDVSKVDDLIKVSSGNVKNLDAFFAGMDDDDSQDSSTGLKDAIQFRKKILTVFDDLCQFSKKLIIAPLFINSPSHDPSRSTPEATNNLGTTQAIGASTATVTTAIKDDHDNHHESQENANFGVASSPIKNDVTFEDDHPDNTSVKSGDVEMDSSCDDSSSGSDDEEYVPSGSNKMAKQKTVQKYVRSPSILSSIDLSGMTPFKRALVTRIVTRAEKMTTPAKKRRRNKSQNTNDNTFQKVDPIKSHWMTYDPTIATIDLDGVKITINDAEESLECSECDYKSRQNKKGNRVEREMYNHIFGRHLKLFSCPQCPIILNSYSRFRHHVQGHQNPYDCDICGKSLKSPDILQSHKWSHMSQQEQAEAVECGLGPPRYIKNKMQKKKLEKSQNKFQCSTCGKGFRVMCHLKLHEKTHREDKDLMCPQCGKTYKSSSGMTYHLRFSCFPGKGKDDAGLKARALRFPCDQCHRRFPYEARLKEHKRAYHSDNPAEYKCSLCDRTFKLNGLRINHEKTHSDARPYKCRKGCGATYKTGNNRARHEKTCRAPDA